MTAEDQLKYNLLELVLKNGVHVRDAATEVNRLLELFQWNTHPQQVGTGDKV